MQHRRFSGTLPVGNGRRRPSGSPGRAHSRPSTRVRRRRTTPRFWSADFEMISKKEDRVAFAMKKEAADSDGGVSSRRRQPTGRTKAESADLGLESEKATVSRLGVGFAPGLVLVVRARV